MNTSIFPAMYILKACNSLLAYVDHELNSKIDKAIERKMKTRKFLFFGPKLSYSKAYEAVRQDSFFMFTVAYYKEEVREIVKLAMLCRSAGENQVTIDADTIYKLREYI